MDRKKYLYMALICATAFTGCSVNEEPEGSTITGDQKASLIATDPNRISGDAAGLAANLKAYGYVSTSTTSYDYDFGFPSACLMWDNAGQDMVSPNTGYNWYRGAIRYTDRVYTSVQDEFIWKLFYSNIKTANDLIATIGANTTSVVAKKYKGEALATRAFDYLNLVQNYQFTCIGHEDQLAVPIVTDSTTAEQGANNPRATVRQVYALIMNDLNSAVTLLSGNTRSDKSEIDQSVAYGLRARANLLMGNWAAAASDAKSALNVDGATPYARDEVSIPAFNDDSNNSFMWSSKTNSTDYVVQTGIVNWPSMLGSLSYGYASLVGCYKRINVLLYDQIPSTDIRKQWWLSANGKSTLLSNVSYTASGITYKGDAYGLDSKGDTITRPLTDNFDFPAYTNVKFAPYQNQVQNSTNAGDWPMMRAEEMILIEAEGLAMSGSTGDARTLLENFVKTYRDPAYVCTATSSTDLQNEIWKQRRIELWGEGFGLFDLLRLKKPVVRKENGVSTYSSALQINLNAESQILIYRIPQLEISANKGITDADNNPSSPTPIAQ